jgi:hypothetical protein
MHACLIVGEAEEYISRIESKKIELPFVKISDSRDLSNFVRLKLTEKTTLILRDFDKSSEEAQNAFLKSLEEPQENLAFVLTATDIDGVLPTIVSRCEVKEMRNGRLDLRDEEREEIASFMRGGIGERLEIVSGITKRDEALSFLRNLILLGHEAVINGQFSIYNLPKEALRTLGNLERNGNVALQLTNFVLNIS